MAGVLKAIYERAGHEKKGPAFEGAEPRKKPVTERVVGNVLSWMGRDSDAAGRYAKVDKRRIYDQDDE